MATFEGFMKGFAKVVKDGAAYNLKKMDDSYISNKWKSVFGNLPRTRDNIQKYDNDLFMQKLDEEYRRRFGGYWR